MKILDVPQSGSIAGVTSSRNRFGQYRRTRAIPVNPNSDAQSLVRARFAAQAEAWDNLTGAQRAGWTSLGSQITRTDSLGQTYTLTGLQAFIMVNANLLQAGESTLSAAPAYTSVTALVSATITLTAIAFSIAYTATPLGTGAHLLAFASPQRSPGRSFENDYRLMKVGAAAGASPLAILTEYTAKFGVPVVGNKIFLSLVVSQNGFESAPLNTSAIVAS